MSYVYALMAGLLAVTAESIFRKYHGTYPTWQLILFALPLTVPISYCAYKLFTSTDYYLTATIIMPFGTMTMRLLASVFVFKEALPVPVYMAYSLIVLAQFVRLVK